MENQHLSLLDRVYTVLRKRGEETEWITSADNHNLRTGIAFVPCDTFTPVSLLYTMIDRPETLVIDVLFAAKVPENRRVEVSIILSELNADQTAGAFQLDPNSGYVYYRQSFVLEGMDLTEAQFAQLMKNIETVAVETAEAYSHIMETEYPKSRAAFPPELFMSEAPQKKGTSWSIGIGLGIAALLIGTAILTDPSVSGSAGEKDKAAAGTVEPLHLQTNTLAISAPGIVKASHLTMLSPGVSGKVDKVHPLFSAGEIVLKGTPLLELEKFEYRARLANAQAGLEQARLDVSTEQAEALKAIKKTYSSVSKSGKESELVLRVPQRRAVNARLNAAEAYVAEAEQALRDTVLEAPYTCQVVECSVGAGARVVAGQPVGKVIPLQERMIRVPVPLEEFSALPRDEQGRVSTALTASCVLNNGKRLQWLGRVTAVDAALDTERNSAVLIASLEPNASHVSEWQVAPVNMALQVNISVQVPASAWIPASAVRDGSSIQVKTAEGMQERKVRVVALKDGKALVTVPELRDGDALAL